MLTKLLGNDQFFYLAFIAMNPSFHAMSFIESDKLNGHLSLQLMQHKEMLGFRSYEEEFDTNLVVV